MDNVKPCFLLIQSADIVNEPCKPRRINVSHIVWYETRPNYDTKESEVILFMTDGQQINTGIGELEFMKSIFNSVNYTSEKS